jgi:TM2 domain-containing membrane protein YozV
MVQQEKGSIIKGIMRLVVFLLIIALILGAVYFVWWLITTQPDLNGLI